MLFKSTVASLTGLAGLALASPLEIAPRQAAACHQVYVSTQVVQYPFVINQYFEDNTIINIGGITINVNGPTSLVTSGMSHNTSSYQAKLTIHKRDCNHNRTCYQHCDCWRHHPRHAVRLGDQHSRCKEAPSSKRYLCWTKWRFRHRMHQCFGFCSLRRPALLHRWQSCLCP
jgi:hypothetical protein